MTDHLLFNRIIINPIIFEKNIKKFNLIKKDIIFNLQNLKYKQKIKTILNLTYPDIKAFQLIFNQSEQILKNIYRFLLVQWKIKKNILPKEFIEYNFEHNLSYFNKHKLNINTEIILKEINSFLNQEQDISNKQKLIFFVINTIEKYYKQY